MSGRTMAAASLTALATILALAACGESPGRGTTRVLTIDAPACGPLVTGDSVALLATLRWPADAPRHSVTSRAEPERFVWEIDPAPGAAGGAASIDAAGLVRATRPGFVTVTVRGSGVTGERDLRIVPPVTFVDLSPIAATIGVGDVLPLALTARYADGRAASNLAATFATGNASVARVYTTGVASAKVAGMGPGTTRVTACLAGRTATTEITVTPKR